jgi:hypothetical protein
VLWSCQFDAMNICCRHEGGSLIRAERLVAAYGVTFPLLGRFIGTSRWRGHTQGTQAHLWGIRLA